jgi:hypothetical protein
MTRSYRVAFELKPVPQQTPFARWLVKRLREADWECAVGASREWLVVARSTVAQSAHEAYEDERECLDVLFEELGVPLPILEAAHVTPEEEER